MNVINTNEKTNLSLSLMRSLNNIYYNNCTISVSEYIEGIKLIKWLKENPVSKDFLSHSTCFYPFGDKKLCVTNLFCFGPSSVLLFEDGKVIKKTYCQNCKRYFEDDPCENSTTCKSCEEKLI